MEEEEKVTSEEEVKEESKAEPTADSKQETSNTKLLCILGYFWILFLLPLFLVPKDDKFGRFHTNQAILYFIASTILGIIAGVLSIIPVVGWIISLVVGLLTLVFLVVQVIAVAQDKQQALPLIGHFKIVD